MVIGVVEDRPFINKYGSMMSGNLFSQSYRKYRAWKLAKENMKKHEICPRLCSNFHMKEINRLRRVMWINGSI
jgi:hypothetical protein